MAHSSDSDIAKVTGKFAGRFCKSGAQDVPGHVVVLTCGDKHEVSVGAGKGAMSQMTAKS